MTKENFQSQVHKIFGRRNTDALLQRFDMLNLPVPDTVGFLRTRDGGFLIPISRYGVTIRITKRNRITGDKCGHLLTPIANDIFYNGRTLAPRTILNVPREAIQRLAYGRKALDFRINPGLRLGVTDSDTSIAVVRCIKDGYVNIDGATFNAGYLPATSHSFPDGIPVFFDPDTIYLLWKKIRKVRDIITGDERVNKETYNAEIVQNDLFQGLRTQYTHVHNGTAHAATFWRACLHAVHDQLLVPGWENSEEERDVQRDIKGVAHAYDSKLPMLEADG